MKNVLMKSILVCSVVLMAAGVASAQTFTKFNPPPCDFSDAFYNNNGILTSNTSNQTAELATEPDGRFGTFRQTGPPATGSQVNWVADTADCSATDPTHRDFRILATTGGNSDDNNSPFTCADLGLSASPGCANQPANGGQVPETLEFISILAFLHAQPTSFENNFAINEGDNPISLVQGTDAAGNVTGLNPRGISMEYIVGNFEAYAKVKQQVGVDQHGNPIFALNPCASDMADPTLAPLQPCFSVADSKDSNGNTISDVATPNLALNWRFATNRNAMDGSDNNCITQNDQSCKHKGTFSDSPFGYFCDDELGMWIITYFWFTQPPGSPNNATCASVFQKIGAKNGFNSEGYPVILTAHELNDELEANGCGQEGKENTAGTDGGAVWLICPAIPDPRNGAIASDAFLDVVSHTSLLDPFVQQNFSCLQQTGKFCFENSVE